MSLSLDLTDENVSKLLNKSGTWTQVIEVIIIHNNIQKITDPINTIKPEPETKT